MNDYYTVTEYAKLTGKDPGNIRRMLIYGELLGEKLGRQWVIPKDVAYPKDKRIKSGKYRNWRKSMLVKRANPKLMRSLMKMSDQLHEVYGSALDRIVLYGSYARGEETAESDVDIALILIAPDTEKQHEKMQSIVVDHELEQEVTLSVISIEEENLRQWKDTLPFYRNLEKEGILLWKAE